MRPEPRAVVRSTLPEARTEVSALVRARLHGAVRRLVSGEAGTGDARSAAGGEAETMPAAGAAGQGERGEALDQRGAKHRREENAAVVSTMRSNMATSVPSRQRR